MLNRKRRFVAMAVGLLLIVACSLLPGGTTPQARLDQPFTLAAGQAKVIEEEGLTVEFVEVTADSRCPTNVDCAWAGEVTVLIAVHKNDQSLGEFELTLGAPQDGNAVTDVDGYTIELLEVNPYRKTTDPIEPSDYQISLTVSAAGSLPTPPEATPTTQPDTDMPQAGLGQPFVLAAGQAKVIEAEGLAVEFVEVAADSRCPSDVLCDWPGEVIVVLAVHKNGQSLGEFELTLALPPDEAAVTDVDGYTIQLLLVTPYPISTEEIAPSDYHITLTVWAVGSPPVLPEVTPTTQPDTDTPQAWLGQPFILAAGQAKVIEAEGLTVEFVEVAEDTRCPSDVECFWAGEVIVVIAVHKNGQSLGEFELTLGVLPDEAAVADVDGYTIQLLEVTPYPISTEEIAPSDYQISLTVSAAGSPPATPSGTPGEPPGGDLTGPPAIRLLIDDTPIDGVPGSFCWMPPPAEDGTILPGICVDTFPPGFDDLDFTPLPAGEPLRLLLDPPLPETLTLTLSLPGEPVVKVEMVPGDSRVEWAYDLPPGKYMIFAFAKWGERGDATYYFGVLIP